MKWTTPVLALLAVAATLFGGDAFELQRGGAAWRIVTCHFTHFTYEQLAWDALAFLALGIACERRNRTAFHATLLASAITVPLAVLTFAPHVTSYRGLSGIDSALFALLLIFGAPASSPADAAASSPALPGAGARTLPHQPAGTPALRMLVAVAFVAKIAFEMLANTTVFAHLGAGVVPVPIAHLAGALTALAVSFRRHALLAAPLLLASCVTLHAPDTRPRLGGCISRTLNGVWTSQHMTQLGPTWQKLILRPDCSYYVRDQLLFMRIAATGTYSIEGDTIRVDDRVLKYERKGRILLVEENGELIAYTRR